MEKFDLLSPWMDYVHKLEAFFDLDDDIEIEYVEEDGEKIIKIKVDGEEKAEALEKLLPIEKAFGTTVVDIEVIPSNEEDSKAKLFRIAFAGNEAVKYIKTVSLPFTSNPFTYVVFEKDVVQYWNDNLGDINGMSSTLYQNLAKEIFDPDGEGTGGVYFCTDVD